MYMLLLALLSTVTVNEVAIEPYILDNTPDQWVAPGYRLVKEAVINPLDYGEPLLLGNECGIGLYSFFVDTPDGEKWRLVMTFIDKVVMLQEDEDPVEYPIYGRIFKTVLSECGRWAIVILANEDDYPGYESSPFDAIMIDLDNSRVRHLYNIYRPFWLGSSGSFISLEDDSLRFYNEDQVQVGAVENWMGNTMARSISYARDGSLLVESVREDSRWVLRAYDGSANTIWESQDNGAPAVSANGDYVFVSRERGIECLDGNTGESLWHVLNEYAGSILLRTSPTGAAWAASIRQEGEHFTQPLNDERLMAAGIVRQEESDISLIRMLSTKYEHSIARVVSQDGCTLWSFSMMGLGFENQTFILSSPNTIILKIYVDNNINSEGRIRLNYNGSPPSELSYQAYSISDNGNRIILNDFRCIYIFSVVPEEVEI